MRVPNIYSQDSSKGAFPIANFFPKDSVYFYGFPTGEDSQFYHSTSSFGEELVSGRSLVCAGEGIKVITFNANLEEYVFEAVSKGVKIIGRDKIISLPREISSEKTGKIRNELVKEALQNIVEDGQLFMAQPFLDSSLEKKFRINPSLSVKVNDKKNKYTYVPREYLTEKYAVFKSGKDFYQDNTDFPYPCVVKVSSSSSGSGVAICKNVREMEYAKNSFAFIHGFIFVEEYIDVAYNICVQIGISPDEDVMPMVIGFSGQLTSTNGDYFGGVFNQRKQIPYFSDIKKVLLEKILPKLRSFGWYGVGGIDVLIGTNGKFYFIDPNFRMTAAFAFVYLENINELSMPTISFSGKVECSQSDFEKSIVSLTKGNGAPLKIISLTKHEDTFRFNAGIQFESINDLMRKAEMLISLGVESEVLKKVIESSFDYKLE